MMIDNNSLYSWWLRKVIQPWFWFTLTLFIFSAACSIKLRKREVAKGLVSLSIPKQENWITLVTMVTVAWSIFLCLLWSNDDSLSTFIYDFYRVKSPTFFFLRQLILSPPLWSHRFLTFSLGEREKKKILGNFYCTLGSNNDIKSGSS